MILSATRSPIKVIHQDGSMTQKLRLGWKLMLFSPILIVMGLVNYYVDPGQIFTNKGFEKEVAHLMNEGHSITATSKYEYDERLLTWQYINHLTSRKQVVAIGSSRVMQITSDFWPHQTFFNAWFPSTQLEDLILDYGFFREKGLLPQTILLGVDPWIFDSSQWHGMMHEEFKDIYKRTTAHMGTGSQGLHLNPVSWVPQKWQAIFSFSYFQDSLKFLIARKGSLKDVTKKGYVLTDKKNNKFFTLWYDGAYFPALNTETPQGELNKVIMLDAIEKPYRLDAVNQSKFEAFVNLMMRDHVKVIFYLPPFHPAIFKLYNGGGQGPSYFYPKGGVERIENYCRSFAASRHIKVVGSYDPGPLSIPADWFYDSRHLRTSEDVRFIFQEAGL
jgi:hypothetical protein